MKISANDIRVGQVLEHEGGLFHVLKTMHTQPGKGGAYMQVEMKDILTGTKQNVRFRSSETVTKASIESQDYTYLYNDGLDIVLMDPVSYEQVSLPHNIVGDDDVFLQENLKISVEYCNDKPIKVSFPENMVFSVVECEPVVKGQTATSSFKPASLENGLKVMVPQFINVGDRIVIKTSTREYVERAK